MKRECVQFSPALMTFTCVCGSEDRDDGGCAQGSQSGRVRRLLIADQASTGGLPHLPSLLPNLAQRPETIMKTYGSGGLSENSKFSCFFVRFTTKWAHSTRPDSTINGFAAVNCMRIFSVEMTYSYCGGTPVQYGRWPYRTHHGRG